MAIAITIVNLPHCSIFANSQARAQAEETSQCAFLAVDEGDTPFVLIHMDFAQNCCTSLLDIANKKQRISETENFEINKDLKQKALITSLALLFVLSVLGVSFARLSSLEREVSATDRKTNELTAKAGFCNRNKELCQTVKKTFQNIEQSKLVNSCDPGNPPENCGNNQIDLGETCDDGRNGDNDGCDCCCMIEAINPLVFSSLCPIVSNLETAEPVEPLDLGEEDSAILSTRPRKLGSFFIQNLCTNSNNFDPDGKVRLSNAQTIIKQFVEGKKSSGLSDKPEVTTLTEAPQCKINLDLGQGTIDSQFSKDCCSIKDANLLKRAQNYIEKEIRNIALILVLFELSIFSVLAITYLIDTKVEAKIVSASRDHKLAIYAASAGIQEVITRLNSQSKDEAPPVLSVLDDEIGKLTTGNELGYQEYETSSNVPDLVTEIDRQGTEYTEQKVKRWEKTKKRLSRFLSICSEQILCANSDSIFKDGKLDKRILPAVANICLNRIGIVFAGTPDAPCICTYKGCLCTPNAVCKSGDCTEDSSCKCNEEGECLCPLATVCRDVLCKDKADCTCLDLKCNTDDDCDPGQACNTSSETFSGVSEDLDDGSSSSSETFSGVCENLEDSSSTTKHDCKFFVKGKINPGFNIKCCQDIIPVDTNSSVFKRNYQITSPLNSPSSPPFVMSCTVTTDCPDTGTPCIDRVCVSGKCNTTNVSNRDCTTDTGKNGKCNSNGECIAESSLPEFPSEGISFIECINDSKCDDGDFCTDDSCKAGKCVHENIVSTECLDNIEVEQPDKKKNPKDCFCKPEYFDENGNLKPEAVKEILKCLKGEKPPKTEELNKKGCNTDDDCSSGRICDTAKKVCTIPTRPTTCNSDTNCSSNEICDPIKKICITKKLCTTSQDCPSNANCDLTKKICFPKIFCKDDSNCRSDQFCNASGECNSKCTSDIHCFRGQTCNKTNGKCESVQAGCKSSSECNSGEICSSGKCELQQSCTITPFGHNCPFGQFCFQNKCWNISCLTNADCPPVQHACNNGICELRP